MFTDPEHPHAAFPRLKGKASELRHFGKPLLQVWDAHKDPTDTTHQTVSLALAASVRAEEILDENSTSVTLPEEAATELKDVLLLYKHLYV